MRLGYRSDSLLVSSKFDKVEQLKLMLLSAACGGSADDSEYRELRRELVSDITISGMLPIFVRNCRSTGEFWEFIKAAPTKVEGLGIWAGRRVYLNKAFDGLLEHLELQDISHRDLLDAEILATWNPDLVGAMWQKARVRSETDPTGAITAARSLLETVIKHILAEMGEEPNDHDLQRMYKQVARALNLAPDQHSEEVFKQILGGCCSIVNGIASVRNGFSDAHGAGPLAARPSQRHARLVVSLAGAFSSFLIESWQNIQARRLHEVSVVE